MLFYIGLRVIGFYIYRFLNSLYLSNGIFLWPSRSPYKLDCYPKRKCSSFNSLFLFSMAISLPTSYVSPPESCFSFSSSSKLSSHSSLRLPSQIRRFGILHERVNSPSSSRCAPLTVSSPSQSVFRDEHLSISSRTFLWFYVELTNSILLSLVS